MKGLLLVISILISNTLFAKSEKDFLLFLYKFENDMAFQMQSTKFPLVYSYLDMAQHPEPKEIEARIHQGDLAEIYPKNLSTLNKEIILNNGSAKVILRKPDTGILLTYRFTLLSGCWRLTEFNDEST